MELVGRRVAQRAIREKRHIVTELTASDLEPTQALLSAMTRAGYTPQMVGLTCDIDVAMQRNLNRGENNISAYYAEPFHRQWLTEAANTEAERPPT